MARLLIVEDHALLGQSLEYALRGDELEVTRCEDLDPDVILEAVARVQPDAVLLDLDLGKHRGSSLPLIAPIIQLGARVLMITGVTDRIRLAECVEAGAAGIIPKSASYQQLLDAIQQVAVHGQAAMTNHERSDLLLELHQHRAAERERFALFDALTSREREILGAVMNGLSADEVARELVVSVATVRSHIQSILEKLGVHSQLAAVALARRVGWQPDQGG
jgi:two-component system, NarL family, nitrate/nitrite response regulator NarL